NLFPVVRGGEPGPIAELIPLTIGEDCDPDGHQCGWDDQYDDAAAQGVNQAGTGRGGLGVTKSAALRVGKSVHADRGDTWRPEAKAATTTDERPTLMCEHHFAKGLMRSKRKLSDQIIFIISMTKMVAGINARRKLRCSSRRCIKYMTPRPA